jgi:hypothetical protein
MLCHLHAGSQGFQFDLDRAKVGTVVGTLVPALLQTLRHARLHLQQRYIGPEWRLLALLHPVDDVLWLKVVKVAVRPVATDDLIEDDGEGVYISLGSASPRWLGCPQQLWCCPQLVYKDNNRISSTVIYPWFYTRIVKGSRL